MFSAFLHGSLLAFGLILPLGPQNSFIISQGIIHRRLFKVVPAIFTAGVSDTLLILLAVTGVSLAILEFPKIRNGMLIVGILFLVYLGWKTWNETLKSTDTEENFNWTIKKQVLFCLSVSLLNPFAILDTVGVIGTSSLTYDGADKIVFVLSCIIVSWMWFFSLAIFGSALSHSGIVKKWLNRISGVVMWGVAIYLVFVLISF
jgi:L-lysine exporter family protein LysE/ArgO